MDVKFNMKNSKSIRSNTGYKGIYFRKDTGKFESHLRMYNPYNQGTTNVHIAACETLKEAIYKIFILINSK